MRIYISFFLFIIYIYMAYIFKPADDIFPVALHEKEILSEMHKAFENDRLEEAKTYAMFIINSTMYDNTVKDEARTIYETVEKKMSNPTYIMKKCANSILKGYPEDINSLFCVFLSDLTIFGDIRDIFGQVYRKLKGENIDWFIAGLSILGLTNSTMDLLRAMWKSGAISEPFAKVIIKEKSKKYAQEIFTLAEIFRKSGVGLAPFSRVMKYINNKQEFDNLYNLVKNYGPSTAYVTITKTQGKIISKPYKLFLYRSSFDLVKATVKDIKKGGPLLADYLIKKLSGITKLPPFLIFASTLTFLYFISNLLLPYRSLKFGFFFSVLLFLLSAIIYMI